MNSGIYRPFFLACLDPGYLRKTQDTVIAGTIDPKTHGKEQLREEMTLNFLRKVIRDSLNFQFKSLNLPV